MRSTNFEFGVKAKIRRKKAGKVRKAAFMTAASLFCITFLGGFVNASDTARAAAGNVSGISQGETAAEAGEKIRAATYYSDDWVINFWNSESADMDAELARIREDGFNTIIVCVPWREFQPVAVGDMYNQYALEKLGRVMSTAQENDLGVMLRLGYTWDYYDESDILKKYENVIYKSVERNAWLNYAKKIYETVSAYPNYTGAFITWEDFWNFTNTAKSMTSGYNARQLAKNTGYAAYANAHYSEDELSELYGYKVDADELCFPAEDTEAYKVFLEFYDNWLTDFLRDTQTVFPGLSMEVRLDVDPYGPEDDRSGYGHDATYPCADADYSSNMLSVNMGFGVNGELIDPEEAAAMSKSILERHRAAAGKPIFCDQFLYKDNTPGFEDNARLPEAGINTYLGLMGPVFRDETIGYGIWTYRDYADNIVYNSQFGLSLDGWSKMGEVSIEETDGNKKCRMKKGSAISQDLGTRNYLSDANTKVSLEVSAEAPTSLTIRVGNSERTAAVSGDTVVNITLPKQEKSNITISAGGNVLIDNIKVYSHVTEAGVYNMDGSEGEHLSGIREINSFLE